MAVRWSNFSANGTWTNTANWSATKGGSTGETAPATGDDVFIYDTVNAIAATDQSSVDLESLHIFGNVNSSGEVKIAVSNSADSVATYSGNGDFQLAAGTNGIDQLIVIRAPRTLYLSGGVFAAVECAEGDPGINSSVEVGGSCEVELLYNIGMSVFLIEEANGTQIIVQGPTAEVTTERAILDGSRVAGRLLARKSAAVSGSAGLIVVGRGHYIHDSSGTISYIEVESAARAEVGKSAQAFTVTNSAVAKGGKLFEQPGVPITYSNATVKRAFV